MSTHTTQSIQGQLVDLSSNPNIGELAQMLCEASTLTDPAAMVGKFGPWIARRTPREAFASISKRDLPEGHYKFTRVLTQITDPRDTTGPSTDPWKSWDELTTYDGGLIHELTQTPDPKLINHADLSTDPVLCEVFGDRIHHLKSLAIIPAYENGEAINWAIMFHSDPEWNDLTRFENGFLDLNLIGTATRNLVTRKKLEELNAELEKQFDEMGKIQQALIPESNPQLDGYTLATSYKPSTQAGGDFYDYFQFPDGRLGVMIADVSGHGAAAATVMAMLGAFIRAFGHQQEQLGNDPDPVACAEYLNSSLLESPLPNIFVTAFIAILDPDTGTIVWTRCGHNPPRIRGVDGSLRSLIEPGTLPLGIMDTLNAKAQSSTLAPGETLVMYTDGITEASRTCPSTNQLEMFGESGLDEALTCCSGLPECVMKTLDTAVREFTGSDHRTDDQTVLVVRHNHPDDTDS